MDRNSKWEKPAPLFIPQNLVKSSLRKAQDLTFLADCGQTSGLEYLFSPWYFTGMAGT